jgi:hypothetical protein
VAALGRFQETLMRRLGPLPGLLAASAVALAAAAVAALAPGSPLAATCAGAGASHAALVVEHGDGSVVTRCVAFDTAAVTGQRLLDSSGVAWSGQTFGGFGEAVCAVDAEPEHYSSCPGSDNYWAVFVSRGGGAWQLTSVGISSLTLNDGDAEGLRYVPAVGTPAPPPVPAGVCSDAAGPSGAGAAGAGGTAGASVRPAANPGAASSSRPGSSVDLGLLAAAVVAIGLGGLALLRLVLRRSAPARRPSR